MVHFLKLKSLVSLTDFSLFMYIQHLACRSTTEKLHFLRFMLAVKGADPGLTSLRPFAMEVWSNFNLPHGKRMCQLTRMQMFKCVFQP